MNGKNVAIWSVVGLISICLIWVIIAAAGIGGEASKVDQYLKDQINAHAPLADMKAHLSQMGYEFDPTSSPTEMNAKGKHYLAVVYNTWLTIKLSGNEEGKATGYHLDREGKVF